MRNLRHTGLSFLSGLKDRPPTACAWDVRSNGVVCAFGPHPDEPDIQIRRWEPGESVASVDQLPLVATWRSFCPTPEVACDRILNLHFFPDSHLISLVLAGGDVVVVRECPLPGEEQIEIVGSVDDGIACAAWSPDEELLALVSTLGTLVFMSREFESVATAVFSERDLQAHEHVSVGWGKAETQFKGRGARAQRDPTIPERIDQGLRSSVDDCSTTVSWRGDGAFLAVNSLQQSSRRAIRIFSRECELAGVSASVDFLEAALAWKPAGDVIAGVQRREDELQVVFFERNGLRHGEYSLRASGHVSSRWASCVSLQWNCDSTILAVGYLDRVQLWTMGNYHYYLKQELILPLGCQSSCVQLIWHSEDPLLVLVSTAGTFCRLEYAWRFCQGSTIVGFDFGVVAVIDGSILKLSPLRLANIPPPMALEEVECTNNIIDVAILSGDSAHVMIAVLQRETVLVYQWLLMGLPATAPVLIASFNDDFLAAGGIAFNSPFFCRQIVFSSPSKLLVLGETSAESYICRLGIEDGRMSSQFSRSIHSPREILSFHHVKPMAPYVVSRHNTIIQMDDDRLEGQDNSLFQLPRGSDSVWVTLLKVSSEHARGSTLHPPTQVTFALTKSGFLYANDKCVAKDCSSYVVTNAHLVFTTSQHLLKIVHLAGDLSVPSDSPEEDERCRRIERGARIVTICPSGSALILQMPRGNLETIYPRAMVLARVRQSISDGYFAEAFFACRTHRVDLNIIHDFAPDHFLTNLDNFIHQVHQVELLDLFLSSLKDEDVSRTMYRDTLQDFSSSLDSRDRPGEVPNGQEPSKVNRICNAFLAALQHRASPHIRNIITAHVCKLPPDLEAGLREVSKVHDLGSDQAEAAIEHICFLVDVNKLYDAALGLYNLHLALMVAEHSQKDPREYMPFLQSLEAQPDLRMRFNIDDYLGRHQKAIRHLAALGAFDEVKRYTIKHGLYKHTLGIYKHKENNLRDVMRLYAENLSRASKHKEAAYVFEHLGDYSAASEEYRLTLSWREALSCAMLAPLGRDQVQQLGASLVASLVETKDYGAAALITLDYLEDVEGSARLFCRASRFSEAICLVVNRARPELLGSIIDVSLVESQGTTTELLAEYRSQLLAQAPRLQELRERKIREPSVLFGAGVADVDDVPDNVSLASTDASTMGTSLFTRYTNNSGTIATNTTRRSSKGRRREERKRARGKKGTVYEEEYLANSVQRLIERVNETNGEVQRLVLALIRRFMRERARAVEDAMVALVGLCQESVRKVFEHVDAVESKSRMENAGVHDQEDALAAGEEEVLLKPAAPTVKTFARQPLLGG